MNYQFGFLKIPVSNVTVSSAFYCDVLGWNEEFVAKEYGWAQLSSGELSLALYEVGKGGGNRIIGGTVDFHLWMDASAFDPLAEQLKTAGHLSENRIHTGNDGSTFIDIVDPDGNIIKVMRQ